MASLYFHTLPGASSAAIDRASVGARWGRICDSGQIVRAHGHGCKVFWRPFLSERDAGDCGDGASWAGEVWRDLQANGGEQPECVGFRNEMHATVRNAAEYLRYRAALRSFGYRGLVALGSFAVGTPDWPEWALLKQGLAGNVPDCCELHEYWDLTIPGSATYYALRHVEAIRRGLLPPEWPIFVGECGSDGIWKELPDKTRVPVEDPQGRRGWQDRGKLTAQQQSANLAAYAAGCAPSVVAAYVFADGTADPNWQTFRTWDTPVEAAIRATWPGNAPQRAQDAPGSPIAAPTAPAPVVSPPPPVSTPVAHKEGHPMAAIPEYDQGNTKLCGIYGLKEVFAAYGYLIDVGTIYQAVHGHAMPDSVGEAATFEQEKAGFVELCTRLGVKYQTLDVTDPRTLAQVVRDGWITLVGVNMADLQAGDNFGHFMLLPPYGFDGPNVHVIDSDRAYDGNTTDVYPWTQVVQACVDNWATPTVDGNRDAVAFKILG